MKTKQTRFFRFENRHLNEIPRIEREILRRGFKVLLLVAKRKGNDGV